jgi:hypothetical protein
MDTVSHIAALVGVMFSGARRDNAHLGGAPSRSCVFPLASLIVLRSNLFCAIVTPVGANRRVVGMAMMLTAPPAL